jgi:putative sigma-54 modulation protein
MDIITTARRFELTAEMRDHVRKRLEKLQRYSDRIDEVHVVLAVEKYRQIAEVSLNIRGTEILSREESDDMPTSIDRVVERAERQIKRLGARRRQDRKGGHKPAGAVSGGPAVEEAEEEAEIEDVFSPVVIREESFIAEALTVEQAIERLRGGDTDYILFKSTRSGRVTLVHQRPDGNFGLVEAP